MFGTDSTTLPTRDPRQRRQMRRTTAVIASAVLTMAGVAGANVALTNFQDAEFNAGGPPCLDKTVGEDVASFPNGFDFDPTPTTSIDGVDLTQEHLTINGVNGDRVLADEVQVIENNCATDLTVSIVNAVAAGDWTGKHLEVWIGNQTNAGAYPAVAPAPGSSEWDQTPIVIDPAGVTTASTGSVLVPAGTTVPVGMVVSTGQTATGQGTATWQIFAEAS